LASAILEHLDADRTGDAMPRAAKAERIDSADGQD
jgi:hypothetical protein